MQITYRQRPINLLYLAGFLALIILGINLGIFLLIHDPQLRISLSDIISPIVDILACIALFISAGVSAARSKRLGLGWGMVALAILFYTLGDVSWAILELGLKLEPFPSIADGCYLAFYPVALVGIFILVDKPTSIGQSINKILDIVIIMLVAALFYWNFLIGPIIQSNAGESLLTQAILLAYPVGDLVVLGALLLIIYNRSAGQSETPIILLAGSFLALIITDTIYSYQSLLGTYSSGNLLDLGWVVSILLAGLAGVSQFTAEKSINITVDILPRGVIRGIFKGIRTYLPYFWLLGAFILLITGGLKPLPMSFLSLSIAVGGIIGLVMVRQIITITENYELRFEISERIKAEEELRSRTDELSTQYDLSRELAIADDLDKVLGVINHRAVESIRTTFARIALLEGTDLVIRGVYPIRALDHDLNIGDRLPITDLPSCQRVLEQNEPVVFHVGDPEIDNRERAALLLDYAQSVCLVPLRVGHSAQNPNLILGMLILGEVRKEGREPFTPEKIRLARSIGDQAAVAIRRMLLREQTTRRLQHLAALGEIDRSIMSSFDLRISLGLLLTQVTAQLGVDAADILLFNPNTNILEFAAGHGFRSTAFDHTELRLGEGYAGRAALERHIIHIADLTAQQDNPRLARTFSSEGFTSYYAVPLFTKGQAKGVLEIFQSAPLNPNEEWLDFLNTLAGQAAIAIDNATLFEGLQRSNLELSMAYDATIEGWSKALDLRDKETEGHTQRVTKMTVNLARESGLSEADLVLVRWGALLHDIGKMGVPDRILLKPGPLTDEEWVVMKKHPVFAYEMLSPISYLRSAVDIPYCHHEKWDGTGYPRNLKGEQIPLTARLFAVVDVWDALTSDRPYRKAWSEEKVREHIQAGSGTHFDPQAVKAFLETENL